MSANKTSQVAGSNTKATEKTEAEQRISELWDQVRLLDVLKPTLAADLTSHAKQLLHLASKQREDLLNTLTLAFQSQLEA